MKTAERLALTTVVLTLVLIGVGAFVRASGSGLGCPDWPTCSGGIVPPDRYHAIIETSHRYVASIVGLLTVATAIAAWKWFRQSRIAFWGSLIGIPLVAIQAIIGMITVKTELPPAVVATHLMVAMLFLSVMAAVWLSMYLEDPRRRDRLRSLLSTPARGTGLTAIAAIAWLAAVMWIGGYVADSGASTACSGWPLCNGSVFPGNDQPEIVHMIHRYLAGLFIFFVAAFVVAAWRQRRQLFWAASVSIVIAVLYLLQVLVGALNVWYTFPDWLSVSHTVIAACIWLTLSAAIVLAFYGYSLMPEKRTTLISTAGMQHV